jgi:hypothetical protein
MMRVRVAAVTAPTDDRTEHRAVLSFACDGHMATIPRVSWHGNKAGSSLSFLFVFSENWQMVKPKLCAAQHCTSKPTSLLFSGKHIHQLLVTGRNCA